MDPDSEIVFSYLPYLCIYKSGRVHRFIGTDTVPAGLDPATRVTSRDVSIDANTGVSARLFLPSHKAVIKKKIPILVYYHGGGFLVGSPFSPTYTSYLNSLVSKANMVAVSVNYRLAPEHLLPAAYIDCWAALKWVFTPGADPWLAEFGDFDRVFVAGDSAGGNICHNLVMRASEKSDEEEGIKIHGMVMACPFFWGSKAIGRETRDPSARSWFAEDWLLSSPPDADLDDPRINFLAKGAPSLARLGCRKVMVSVAELDFLAARGKAYYDTLEDSGWGGEAEFLESEGEGHVFHLDKPESEKAVELMEKMVAFFDSPAAEAKIARSDNFNSNSCKVLSYMPCFSSKSSLNVSHEASGQTTIEMPRDTQRDGFIQTTLEKHERGINAWKSYSKFIPLINGGKIVKSTYEKIAMDNSYCTQLVEDLGELKHELEMKEETHHAQWKIGSRKIATCVAGFSLGLIISLFLLFSKTM